MPTKDIELYPQGPGPKTVRIEKRGNRMTMWVSLKGEPLQQVAGPIEVELTEPFYVGIGLSSHEKQVTEKAVFSNVELKPLPPQPASTSSR